MSSLRTKTTNTYLTLRDANRARQAEWDPDNRINLSFRGLELGGEVGEALNLLKKYERERMGIRGSRTDRVEIGKELADVLICVDLIMMDLGLDRDEVVAEKFNETSEKYGLKVRLAKVKLDPPVTKCP